MFRAVQLVLTGVRFLVGLAAGRARTMWTKGSDGDAGPLRPKRPPLASARLHPHHLTALGSRGHVPRE